MLRKILVLVSFSFLAACSGGGGSAPNGPNMSFNPGKISGETFEGTSQTFTINAALDRGVPGVVNVGIIDKVGVISPTLTLTPVTQLSYNAIISTQANLPVGNYKGNLEVRLCSDAPTVCASPIPGSPWLLPYDLTVKSNIGNLSQLTALVGAGSWGMHQGNASHTGYVPVTLDPAKFNFRWRWLSPVEENIHPVVVANGIIYASSDNNLKPNNGVFAISESNKNLLWQNRFMGNGTVKSVAPAAAPTPPPSTTPTPMPSPIVNPPSVSDGKVFLATSGHGETFMWAFDAGNGSVLSKQDFTSQRDKYYAPTVLDGAVYTDGGSFGGMLSFKQIDGRINWFANLAQFDRWTPAVDALNSYAYLGDGLNVLDKNTGVLRYKISDPNFIFGEYSIYGSPIIGTNNNILAVNGRGDFSGSNRLNNFDLVTKNIKWSVSGHISNEPALAKGIIYFANGPQIEARNESDGLLLWAWMPQESSDSFSNGYGAVPRNIIVTDSHLFVSTKTKTYAVSLLSHQAVWSYPIAGSLALSTNGILYIASNQSNPSGTSTGLMFAINLH
jgi:PQQ-like domain